MAGRRLTGSTARDQGFVLSGPEILGAATDRAAQMIDVRRPVVGCLAQ
jgi:hypothetical protein